MVEWSIVGVRRLILLTALLSGCAGLQTARHWQGTEDLPSRVELNDIPFYPQDTYQCGPAALAMVLSWSGLPTRPQALVSQVYTPSRQGSLQAALVGAARRHGRLAYPLTGTDGLLTEVAAGHPVIVLQNLGLSWYPVWHYAVVIGYNLAEETVVLHSGTTAHKRLSFRVFNNTWARSDYWGLVVLEPAQAPATAQEQAYLEAVLGLEKARQWRAAIAGYRTALERWPHSLVALMGLGNSLYALGRLEEAEAILREAGRLHPDSGLVFNNLAQVLWEQGRRQEALEAAQKAVVLGGELKAIYAQTLEEIRSARP